MYTDHTGEEFKTKYDMCRKWGISTSTLDYRLHTGLTLEEALTYGATIGAVDHNGVEYKDVHEMAKSYGISAREYVRRVGIGLTKEEALTGILKESATDEVGVIDHKGKVYRNMEEMCQYYGVTVESYTEKRKAGVSVYACLGCRRFAEVTDHLGNVFVSLPAMCQYYGITQYNYEKRLEMGYTVQEALTVAMDTRKQIKDHKGRVFDSETAMCREYGVDYLYYIRKLNSGYSLEDILTGKTREVPKKEHEYVGYTDHLNNKFKSVTELCDNWGVRVVLFRARLKMGFTLAQALETPDEGYIEGVNSIGSAKPVVDHVGNKFRTVGEMCRHWGVSEGTYRGRLRGGKSMEEALSRSSQTRGIIDHKGNRFDTIKDMCRHWHIKLSTYYKYRKMGVYTLEEILELGDDEN